MSRLVVWAKHLKREVSALSLAYGDPRCPWTARIVAAVTVAYALSPIDLIPDFIPLLGLLDDLLLVPLGIALSIRLIPPELMDEARRKVANGKKLPKSKVAAIVVVLLWLLCFFWVWRRLMQWYY